MRGLGVKWGSTEFKKGVPRRDLAPQWASLTLAHTPRIALFTRRVEEPPQAVRDPERGRRRGDPRPGDEHPRGDRGRFPSRPRAGALWQSGDEDRGHAG